MLILFVKTFFHVIIIKITELPQEADNTLYNYIAQEYNIILHTNSYILHTKQNIHNIIIITNIHYPMAFTAMKGNKTSFKIR